jgi:hypothetical protein
MNDQLVVPGEVSWIKPPEYEEDYEEDEEEKPKKRVHFEGNDEYTYENNEEKVDTFTNPELNSCMKKCKEEDTEDGAEYDKKMTECIRKCQPSKSQQQLDYVRRKRNEEYLLTDREINNENAIKMSQAIGLQKKCTESINRFCEELSKCNYPCFEKKNDPFQIELDKQVARFNEPYEIDDAIEELTKLNESIKNTTEILIKPLCDRSKKKQTLKYFFPSWNKTSKEKVKKRFSIVIDRIQKNPYYFSKDEGISTATALKTILIETYKGGKTKKKRARSSTFSTFSTFKKGGAKSSTFKKGGAKSRTKSRSRPKKYR